MSYSQLSDIQNLVPNDILIQLTDDANTGSVNAAIVTDCITEADNFIDSWIGSRYQLPLASPIPPMITYISVAIAVHRLYGRKGFYQYQCVVPPTVGREAIDEILSVIAKRGATPAGESLPRPFRAGHAWRCRLPGAASSELHRA